MSKKILKVGILGALRGASIGESILGEKNIRITAACDLMPERLEAMREMCAKDGCTGVETYTDYGQMLRFADIDAVIVATPKTVHAEHCIMALRAGKHVLSEIPAICTVDEARRLKTEVLLHPELTYMIAENCCYWAFIDVWKRMRGEGKFGEIVYAEGEYLHSSDPDDLPDYKNDPWRAQSNAITYLTHQLGPLLQIMDDRCTSVSCMASEARYNPIKTGFENNAAVFKTAKGAVIRIFICFGAFVGYDHNFALYGTRGSIVTDRCRPIEEAHSFAKLYEIPGSMQRAVEIPVGMAYPGDPTEGHGGAEKKMLRDFADCVLKHKTPTLDIDAAVNMSLPGIFAEESARQGGVLLQIPQI